MTQAAQHRRDRFDGDGAVELFLKVVGQIRTRRCVGIQVEGDADFHAGECTRKWARRGRSIPGSPAKPQAATGASTVTPARLQYSPSPVTEPRRWKKAGYP